MNKKTKILTIIALVLFSLNSLYASARTDIRYLVKKYNLENAKISIASQRTMNGQNLYSYAQNRPMIPASNNKLFTMVAALFTLPNDFRFTTTVYYSDRQLKNHVLNGDLYIKFSGDPTLTGNKLSRLIKNIKTEKGINKITGSVYLINVFSGAYIPKGWSKEDSTFCYGAPASSFTLNRNCTVIELAKDPDSDNTNIIKINNTSNITIKNSAKYTNSYKPTIITKDDNNIIYLSGYLSRVAEKMFDLSIKNPALKTLDVIDDFMTEDGIKHNKISILNYLPAGSHAQLSIKSADIGRIINLTLQHSDNLYAETILNTIALKKTGVGSTKAGTDEVEKILYNKLHLNIEDLVMYDGSGLSHFDNITTQFMVNFLTKTFNSPVGKQLYEYLPTSGINGTIAYRMSKKLLGKVRAKTGTLAGASNLSGYVLTAKNHRISFSIMLNDLKASQRYNARRFQDEVVGVFYKYL